MLNWAPNKPSWSCTEISVQGSYKTTMDVKKLFFRFYLFERETETSSHPLLHSPNGLCLSARPCVSFFKIYLKVELHTGDGRGRSIALPWLVHSQNAATGKAGPLHSYELHSGVSHGWQGPKHL